jgi:hypothetical protein
MLRALVPGITDEEVREFFKFRDSPTEDRLFRSADDFLKYLQSSVQFFRNDEAEVRRFKTSLEKRGLYLVVDESQFKITVQARVGQATRTLEAWVMLTTPRGAAPGSGIGQSALTAPPSGGAAALSAVSTPIVDTRSGIRVLFVRIL